MIRWSTLALLLFWSAASAAGNDRYRYRETFEGWPSTSLTNGVVATRGSAYRVELYGPDEKGPFAVIVSRDGEQEIAVNGESRTFYPLKDVSHAPIATSRLFGLLPSHEGRASEVTVRVEEAAGESLTGHPTNKTSLLLAYKLTFAVGRHSIRGHVEAMATFWTTDAISLALPQNLRPGFKTGFAEVDAKVSEALAGVEGFPLKQELRVTGTVEGEPPSTERFEIVVDSFDTSECTATCFEVPKGFVYRVPVLSKPGVESRVLPEAPDR